MCWHLLAAPVIGGQPCAVRPLSYGEWLDKKVYIDEKSPMTWPHEVVLNVEAKRLGEKILTTVWKVMSRMNLI